MTSLVHQQMQDVSWGDHIGRYIHRQCEKDKGGLNKPYGIFWKNKPVQVVKNTII